MKYIVYITINMVNNKIYVGVHKTNTPYEFDGYLGCGVKVNDRYTYRFCHTPFEAAVNKYGPKKFKRYTLYVFDTIQEALQKESEIVNAEFISRKDTYNIALGGNVHPANCKVIYQYNLDGTFIKEWPSITEAALFYKCSNSTIGKAIFDRTPRLKFFWTDNKYDALDLNTFHINENKTKCYLYNISGDFLKEFESIKECSTFINTSIAKVSKAIRGKFCIEKKWYCSDIKYDKFEIPQQQKHTIVYQYDLQGNYIQSLSSWDHSVSTSIRLGNSCKGFQYSWEKLEKMPNLKPIAKARKVGKYTLENKLLQVFDTVRAAKKYCSGVPHVLSGKRKTAGGFIWKYIDD